jgi:ADP-glucose pyrophosphorylase
MPGQRVLGIVLAGGPGRRLVPLTADRAKSAMTFGGFYRGFAVSSGGITVVGKGQKVAA